MKSEEVIQRKKFQPDVMQQKSVKNEEVQCKKTKESIINEPVQCNEAQESDLREANQNVEMKESIINEPVQCKEAQESVLGEVNQNGEMKECPFCGEVIKAIAKKCKHCGEMLDEAMRAAEEAAQSSTAKKQGPKKAGLTHTLCIGLGFTGAHRFYTGHTISGVVYLVTFMILGVCLLFDELGGLFFLSFIFLGVCLLCDELRLVFGKFKDADGNKLVGSFMDFI